MGNAAQTSNKITITSDAKKEFIKYMKKHSKAKKSEEKCSGLDIIKNIDKYFEIELYEENHSNILKLVKENNYVMSKEIMKLWTSQNYYEIYVQNKKC
jgi:hypothetical protein